MPQTRQPITIQPQTHRRLQERLALRFPRLLPLAARVVYRMPPRRRLRRLLLRHGIQLSVEALNRGDYEACFALWDRACESTFPAQMTALGDEPGTHGRNERIAFQQRWTAGWRVIRFEPAEIVDLGDRILVVGRVKGTGLASGAVFDNEWAVLVAFSAASGRVIREQVFLDHAEATAAAGLGQP